MKLRHAALALLVSGSLLVGGEAVGAAPADPSETAMEAGASNMGICSSYLGRLQVRDDVNQIILEYGEVLGISNPGELYHVRAQQSQNAPTPAQECQQRAIPR
ncbi:MAG: hypothetical protein M3Q65_22195 [Chloroflexota bacterium]|nr:hypothetical protein [Chloroflexota bacterium]